MIYTLSEKVADELLSDALAGGRLKSLRLLLNASIDPRSAACDEALKAAQAAGYGDAEKLLLEARANRPVKGRGLACYGPVMP